MLAGLFFTYVVSAQQKPQYTQYVINEYIINPALTGIENYADIKIGHRHQWAGLQGAPVTTYVTFHGPIGKKDYKTNATTIFEVPGENPRGKDYWDNYSSSPAHHGLGVQFIKDQVGPFTYNSFMATYAYHMPVGQRTNLSAGIAIGGTKVNLSTDKLFFGVDYPVDPAVYSGRIGKTKVDVNAGLWLYSANYFVGLAALQLVPQKLDFSDDPNRFNKGKMVAHWFGTAGYRFLLNEDINVLPSVMVKIIDPVPPQVDINAKMTYRDRLWVGGSYRVKYGFAGMAGFNAMNLFTLSYSYDYSHTKINQVSQGTHEIIIGFILGNKYSDDTCPRNNW